MPDLNKKADKATAIGVLQIFAGGVLISVFTIIALINRVWVLLTNASSSLPFFLFLISILIGAFFIGKGYGNYKLASRYRRIHRTIGDDPDIELSVLENKLGWDRKKLLKTLRRQASLGYWPNSFLDTTNSVFILGYTPSHISSESGNLALDELTGKANGFIHDMTTVTRSIDDDELKSRVTVLTDCIKQIYSYIESNPDRASDVRQLTNYFLPTSINLLRNYVALQNQTVKSDNMNESMQKIADLMSTLEEAFKKQLNDLYSNKAMDVSVEIEVMQNMLGM